MGIRNKGEKPEPLIGIAKKRSAAKIFESPDVDSYKDRDIFRSPKSDCLSLVNAASTWCLQP